MVSSPRSDQRTFSSSTTSGGVGWARQNRAWLQNCPQTKRMEEAMNIDRRQLILPALAFGLLSVAGVSMIPALAASADEEAVAKNVEAFRAAQVAADAKAFDTLCAPELSYSHSSGKVEDKIGRASCRERV